MIELRDLSKVYSNGKGVFDVSFNVAEGEVFGFLGPNGAGKTTTIRALLGFTNASKGSCSINDMDCRRDAAKIQKILGYVPGEIAFFENMTGIQFLKFMADMRGTKDVKLRNKLIERFELETDRKIRKMSKGMKQKVGLIAAFMHDPRVIVLDEPTSGLDPLMQKRFIELIIEEKRRGKTILMSSHMFDEVDRTCSRAAIIWEGRIVAVEDIPTLKSTLRKSYLVTVADKTDIKRIEASGLEFRLVDDNRVEIFVSDDYSEMLSTLAACKVTSLDAAAQTLEQIFIRYYGKEAS
ncbi:MAG: ABC transporter ATP-binding protein [Firmicutes bacterium]|nr:ABC transporter ATP-binding protein [Bacillota bacterium]